MISQTLEYALRAVVCLAGQADAPKTADQIAELTHVPRGYLSKVLQQLGRANLLQAQRGIHGGFRLRRDPEMITVLDVVNAVDPIQRIRECPLGLEEHARNFCRLHRKLDEALATVEVAFESTTIAELVGPPERRRALCRDIGVGDSS